MAIFEQDDTGHWIGGEKAQGPFTGLQGGGVASVMVAEIEAIATQQGLGAAMSVSVEFFRPTPLMPLKTNPKILRRGRRSSVLTNEVWADGKQTASATVCVINPVEGLAIAANDPSNIDVSKIDPLPARAAPHGRPWLMDNFEIRPGTDGVVWFHHKDEITPDATPLASVLGPADWTHGLARPSEPKLADPNVNLQVALARHPRGEHIGIRPKTTWMPEGTGLGEGAIFDEHGEIGRVAMSAVLIPFP
ncbi:acyl-CoA thioesterase domain-containing protein [Qipengyuania sp. DGS5-3]|uniref:acyl-CoA thioesterase domain-containing protein n=1 Tax=Qipengyuania sp. DGS5-3 TaxID=3349632 RepID=UPI0036D43A0B